jgi:hypothetical protein
LANGGAQAEHATGARRIAVNIAKLPELLGATFKSRRCRSPHRRKLGPEAARHLAGVKPPDKQTVALA